MFILKIILKEKQENIHQLNLHKKNQVQKYQEQINQKIKKLQNQNYPKIFMNYFKIYLIMMILKKHIKNKKLMKI